MGVPICWKIHSTTDIYSYSKVAKKILAKELQTHLAAQIMGIFLKFFLCNHIYEHFSVTVKIIIFYLNFRSFYTNNCSPAIEPNHLQQCRQPKYLHTYLISIIITNYYFPPPNLILLKSPFKTHHPPPNILTLCFYNVHTASTTY